VLSLSASPPAGITTNYNATTGVLTLSGSSSVANYQAALRSVTFKNTTDNPSTETRAISFVANNGVLDSNPGTRDVAVTAVNDAPTLTSLPNRTINEDAGSQAVSLNGITAGNGESQSLTVSATSGNTALIRTPIVTYTSPNTTGTLSLSPVANANGSTVIKVVVQDNGGTANGGVNAVTNTFTVTVNPVDDVPSFSKGPDQNVLPCAGAQSVSGWATAISPGPANESAQAVDFLVTNSNPGLFVVQPAVSAGGTLTYTVATNAHGVATMSVKIHDDGGTANGGVNTSAAQTATVTVADNEPPTISGATNLVVSTTSGECFKTNVTWTVTASDNCGWATVVCVPGSGSTLPVGRTTVTCTATDASGNTNSSTFTVRVVSPPWIEAIGLSNAVVTIRWSACANETYRVQYKTNLDEPNWTDLVPDVTASGSGASRTDAPGATQRFYRILVVE
jgi:hypothetical protein